MEREEIKQALKDGYGESSRYSDTLTVKQFYSAIRLPDGSVLRLSIQQIAVWTLILGFFQPICIVILIALVLSIVLALRLAKKIVEPINQIDPKNPEQYLNQKNYKEVAPLADMPEFQHLLVAFSVPIVGVLFGAVFTGIIQSSAASVGILQALSMTGTISYRMAIPIIMGQNIGTCVTALISSIGVNRNAKRVTVVHMLFNIIGTVICLLVFYGLDALVHFTFLDKAINPVEIAFVHSVFNILTTIILLPFSKLLVKLAYKIIPEAKGNKNEDKTVWLDERLLASPPLATSQCRQKAKGMAKISKTAMQDAVGIMLQYDQKIADKVEEAE